MTIFHFQFYGEAGWEALGAGSGEGEEAIRLALDELRGFCGGRLRPGRYAVIEARSEDAGWSVFELDDHREMAGGRIVAATPDHLLRSD